MRRPGSPAGPVRIPRDGGHDRGRLQAGGARPAPAAPERPAGRLEVRASAVPALLGYLMSWTPMGPRSPEAGRPIGPWVIGRTNQPLRQPVPPFKGLMSGAPGNWPHSGLAAWM